MSGYLDAQHVLFLAVCSMKRRSTPRLSILERWCIKSECMLTFFWSSDTVSQGQNSYVCTFVFAYSNNVATVVETLIIYRQIFLLYVRGASADVVF